LTPPAPAPDLGLLKRELIVLIPLLAAQVGISARLLDWTTGKKLWRMAAIAFVIVDATLAVLMLAGDSWMVGLPVPWQWAYWMSGPTTVGFVWMFSAFPAYLAYQAWRWASGRKAVQESPERRKLLQAAGTVAMAAPFAAMAYGVAIGRFDFHVREVDLKIPNLHPDLEGLRILQLSDVHLGQYLSERDFARVIDMSNGLRPHLAVMTGDLVSSYLDPLDRCILQLSRVRSDAGMLGCLGNHEKYIVAEEYTKEEAAKYGIRFLRSERHSLKFGNASINVAGFDYQRGANKKNYLKGGEQLLAPGTLNLMLSHNPDVFPTAARQGWDVTLSGHTHGGQVTLEIVEQTVNIARFYTPYVTGKYELGNARCYVTRGIGTIGIPARVGVPPEITLLRLRKA
jgi:predicted MPP superfamily phosphohydrolase